MISTMLKNTGGSKTVVDDMGDMSTLKFVHFPGPFLLMMCDFNNFR